jgi:hypothetical protein
MVECLACDTRSARIPTVTMRDLPQAIITTKCTHPHVQDALNACAWSKARTAEVATQTQLACPRELAHSNGSDTLQHNAQKSPNKTDVA